MPDQGSAAPFAAFREAVLGDFNLLVDLRRPLGRDAWVARVVALGAARGLAFDEDVVRAALREGEATWMARGDLANVTSLAITPADHLFGWTPFRAALQGPEMRVDWCHLYDRRFFAPTFADTVAEAMGDPFNLVFQQQTSANVLRGLPAGLPVAGFVFHMSRCGSTAVSQVLAAFENNVVVAEAPPLGAALRASRAAGVGRDRARTWFAGLINAYAQARFAYEQRLIVKFAAADALDITLVREAFPDVPWVFLTRDPSEILASRAAAPGNDLAPGRLDSHLLGLDEDLAGSLDPDSHRAHALAAIARAALDAVPTGGGLIVDHAELPDALWTRICPHFGMSVSHGAVEAMRSLSGTRSKVPGRPFVRETDPNRLGAAAFRPVTEPLTGEVMGALAALRRPGEVEAAAT